MTTKPKIYRGMGTMFQRRVIKAVENLDPKAHWKVTISEDQSNRSLAQNSLYWKWLTVVSENVYGATGKLISPKGWHWYFREMFLGYEAVELPDGRIEEQLISTATLKVKPFADYLDNMDHHCGADLEIQLPYPEDLYQEAMGRKR